MTCASLMTEGAALRKSLCLPVQKNLNGLLRKSLLEEKEFEWRYRKTLKVLGSVEFALVPVFLALGLHRKMTLGMVLVYCVYLFICVASWRYASWVVDSGESGKNAWLQMWERPLLSSEWITSRLPHCVLRCLPASPVLSFLLDIPAYTDNMMLSLSIANVQSMWAEIGLQVWWANSCRQLRPPHRIARGSHLRQAAFSIMFFSSVLYPRDACARVWHQKLTQSTQCCSSMLCGKTSQHVRARHVLNTALFFEQGEDRANRSELILLFDCGMSILWFDMSTDIVIVIA